MADTIQVEISSEQPAVAASLSELRYLVFQGMIGPDGKSAYELAVELGFEGSEEDWIASLKGERGETLGWDVTDDGAGNVEMTYPDGVINSQKSVLFEEQTLTTAQKAQARENIGAASATDVDDLTDTVGEHNAEIIALETISDNQASDANVLELAARSKDSDADAAGMSFVMNDDETFTIYGTNTTNNNAIFYTSAAAIASASALKPPAGVYRLEISADQAADFTAVWGVLYIGNANQFVITDAVGKSVEVYLDGNTPVASGIVVGPGKNANGLKLTVALRRVGVPEIGKLLVDQINQMQALQRKALSVLDTITQVYKRSGDFDALNTLLSTGEYTVKRVQDVTASNSLNAVGAQYKLTALRYNSSTLYSPYNDSGTAGVGGVYDANSNPNGTGITNRTDGVVIDYHTSDRLAIQIGLPAGEGIIAVRRLYGATVASATWSSWAAV